MAWQAAERVGEGLDVGWALIDILTAALLQRHRRIALQLLHQRKEREEMWVETKLVLYPTAAVWLMSALSTEPTAMQFILKCSIES